MKVTTTRFGTLEIEEKDLISFPQGLLGFPEHQDFFILEHPGGPFSWLQSVTEPDLAFVVIDPCAVVESYDIRLAEGDANLLGVNTRESDWADEVGVLAIANVSDPYRPTVNLLAPLCVSYDTRRGVQAVQHHSGLSVRHPFPTGDGTSGRQAA